MMSPPPMYDFYEKYYRAVEHSRAHATFCERAYGKNLAQHGFVTMDQLAMLVERTGLSARSYAVDLGCGDGRIAEYLSDVTGSCITGLDYIPSAIARACERTRGKQERLSFVAGDLTRPDLQPAAFDTLLSLDTIYFSDDYVETLRRWQTLLQRGGQMAIFFSHGADPEHPKETFRRETLPPDRTPLADALETCGLAAKAWDLTQQDLELAQRKASILEELKAEFEAEGNGFLYENRMGEALGVSDAVTSGMHARYLYVVRT